MANMLFANNANTTLASSLTNSATSMSVTSATAFPSPTGSQYFYCTLADAATQQTIEIVKVTAVSGTTFTIVRGQDGTSGTAFNSGDVVSLRLVRASLNDFPKLDEVNTYSQTQTFSAAPITTTLTGYVYGNGSSAQTASTTIPTSALSGQVSVSNGGTGLSSLTQGYIPYGTGTSAFGSTSGLFWDSTNSRLGIGFSSPTAQIEIAGYPNATFKMGDGGSGTYTFSRQAGDGYFHNVDNSGSFGFIWTTGSTEIMRTSGSNLQFSQNANGIKFNNGSSSLLADYEEGTWSPTLTTGTGSLTYANQGSNYIKIGHMVLAYGYINVSAISSPTGALTIGGLPFTNQPQYGAVTLDFFGGTLTSAVGGYIVASSTTMVTTNFSSATIAAGGNILFTAVYKST